MSAKQIQEPCPIIVRLFFDQSMTQWKAPHYSCYTQLQSTHLPCDSYKSECHQYLLVDDSIETLKLCSKRLEYSPKYCSVTITNLICDLTQQLHLDLIP